MINHRQARSALKWALKPQPGRRFEDEHGRLKEWAEKKLDGLVAYGLVDKTGLPERALRVTKLHYFDGVPVEALAKQFSVSPRTIANDLTMILNHILDNAPKSLIASLVPAVLQWRVEGCPKCGGSQYWDIQGAYGYDGEYCCINCGWRVDWKGESMRQPIAPSD